MSHEIVNEDSDNEVIRMSEMKPCQWARIVDSPSNSDIGDLVRRSSLQAKNIVDDMSNPKSGGCWDPAPNSIKVRPLKAGHKITIEIK